jgi:hypothetical protein
MTMRIRTPLIALMLVGISVFASPAFPQAPLSTNRSRGFGPDACGPADPAYIHTANETGGIPMFLQRSEAAKSFHLMRESTRFNVSTVFWATGNLDPQSQTIEIPVDSVTQRITFAFSVDTKGGRLVLQQPSGGRITEATASTEITELNCGRIVTIVSPEPGTWRADLAGSGKFWLEAQAQSDIFLINVQFVKQGGRPGHEGMFRIPGQPVAGQPATLEASLSGKAVSSTEFHLVSERGEAIQQLKMHAVNSDRDFLEMMGTQELPSVPFRVAMTGRDIHGKTYQRFFAGLFHAENVEVIPKLDFDELPSGGTRQAIFALRNIGAARTFKFTVTDARHFVSNVEPKELELGAGEMRTIAVDLSVPAGTAPGTGDDLVIVAASIAGPPATNSSVVHLSVSGSSPK